MSLVHPRRTLPGSASPSTHTVIPLSALNGQFAVGEYIRSLINVDPSDLRLITDCPSGVDSAQWLYEHILCLLTDLALWIHNVGAECDCATMCASADWEFLCAAHAGVPAIKCSAVNYCAHNIAAMTAAAHNTTTFPNRIAVNANAVKTLAPLVRRVYRIFAHAAYHHTAAYDALEAKTFLSRRFIALFTANTVLMDNNTFTPPLPPPSSSTSD